VSTARSAAARTVAAVRVRRRARACVPVPRGDDVRLDMRVLYQSAPPGSSLTPPRAMRQVTAMGRYFEDFRVGELIKHWPGRTIRDFDDTWFTLMTMNTNPLHFDDHFASRSQHGRCLVNGTLVFSLAVGMSVRDISENALANLEYEKVLHHAPTFHGDTLYAQSEILDVTPSQTKNDRGVVYVETSALNQRGEKVLSLRRRVLVLRRPS